ncbi:MAG: cytochrome c [Candidatus Tectomicrobia bacterium]|uniref:Cytochrome c n=1 Tax=Tectimicrobiota bacterium TaxID=2528274 RepID=A0A933GPV2_UNCTE|nr:cytochrome c [Candidatus Tectomicrobia bacterium]
MKKEATPINPNYLFSTNCASCHSLQGQRASGPGGALLPSRLASLSDEQVQEIIAKGRGSMPSFENRLNPAEIAALVDFLKY